MVSKIATLVMGLLIAACNAAPAGSGAPGASGGAGSSPTPAATVDPAIPTLARVGLDPGHAAKATIGWAGGRVEATGADGTAYVLTIPPEALADDTEIRAVPVTAVETLPTGAAVAGGVHFLPEGLTFRLPAELTITLAVLPEGGVLPFAYRGDLDEPFRYPVSIDGSRISFPIVHFSGYALLMATEQGQNAAALGVALSWEPPSGPIDNALASIAAVIDDSSLPNRAQKVRTALQKWINQAFKPMVADFKAIATWSAGDPWHANQQSLRGAFLLWGDVMKILILAGAEAPDLRATVDDLAVEAALHGIARPNAGCTGRPGEELLARMDDRMSWQKMAERLGVAGRDPLLARASVLEQACVKVKLDPVDGTVFPESIAPGDTGTLKVHAGFSVDGGPTRTDAQLELYILPVNVTATDTVYATPDAGGRYTHDFTFAPSATAMQLMIQVCLYQTPLCAEATIDRDPTSQLLAGFLTIQAHRVWNNGATEDTKVSVHLNLRASPSGITVDDYVGDATYTASDDEDGTENEILTSVTVEVFGDTVLVKVETAGGVQTRDVRNGTFKGRIVREGNRIVRIDFELTESIDDGDRPAVKAVQHGTLLPAT